MWEVIVKDDIEDTPYYTLFEEFAAAYENLTKHPSFSKKMLDENYSEEFWGFPHPYYSFFSSIYEEFGDTAPTAFDFTPSDMKQWLIDKEVSMGLPRDQYALQPHHSFLQKAIRFLQRTYGDLAKIRSLTVLRGMAESMGKTITIKDSDVDYRIEVDFSHEGLDFTLRQGRLHVKTQQGITLVVCVVDERELPVGDYLASLLGLVVAKPEQIPTVEFSIEFAKLINKNPGINWGGLLPEDWTEDKNDVIGIFTPFERDNDENSDFGHMLYEFYDYAVGQTNPTAYMELEKLLTRIFGREAWFE